MSWLKNLIPGKIRTEGQSKKGVPEGLWTKCEACNAILYRAELERNLNVCPKCDFHHYIAARSRLAGFMDGEDQSEIGADVGAIDMLKFRDSKKYKDRLVSAQKLTDEKEALVCLQGKLYNMSVICCAFEYKFIGGSMGSAVGERFVKCVDAARSEGIPFICFSASGGARMQEGLLSLLQMSKTAAALKRLSGAGIPYFSVLTDPTMGGVAASLATLGDIIIGEPGARVGFAGPRVIEQTVRETLPEGFQRSEFLLDHGAIDMIIDRRELRPRLASLLAKLMYRTLDLPETYHE